MILSSVHQILKQARKYQLEGIVQDEYYVFLLSKMSKLKLTNTVVLVVICRLPSFTDVGAAFVSTNVATISQKQN